MPTTLLLKMPIFSGNYYYMCVPQILSAVYARSGQPNHYRPNDRMPWPPLQTFEFVLQKFLGLRLAQDFSTASYDIRVGDLTRDSGDIYHEDNLQWPAGAEWVFGAADGGENNKYDSFFAPMT